MKTLHKSERMKNVFKELPIVSYKRNKNIKDILVHRKHSILVQNDSFTSLRFTSPLTRSMPMTL
jgi:hypothetical protein